MPCGEQASTASNVSKNSLQINKNRTSPQKMGKTQSQELQKGAGHGDKGPVRTVAACPKWPPARGRKVSTFW